MDTAQNIQNGIAYFRKLVASILVFNPGPLR